MRKEVRIEGTPFTQRRKVVEVREPGDTRVQQTPDQIKEALDAWVEATRDPWERQRPIIEEVARSLTEERAGKPVGYRFLPRDETGWYLEELAKFARMADDHIAGGNASWAAHAGLMFGELYCELQLKLAREKRFLAGLASQKGAGRGGKLRGSSVKIVDRQAEFFRVYDDAVGRSVPDTIARQKAAKLAGYNEDYARRLLAKR